MESRPFIAPAASDLTRQRLAIAKRALVCVAIAVCALIAVAYFRGLRNPGYLDSAIVSTRELVAAETQFSQSWPDIGYTCEFSKLADEDLTRALTQTGKWNGYAFELSGCQSANGAVLNRSYQVTARPLHPGMPAVCADQSGIVKTDDAGSVQHCISNGTPL